MCRAAIDMPENLSTRSVLEKKIEELEARVRIMNQMIRSMAPRRERVIDLTGGTDSLLTLGSASERLEWQQMNILQAFIPGLLERYLGLEDSRLARR